MELSIGMSAIYINLLLAVTRCFAANKVVRLDPVHCGSYEDFVRTDDSYRYHPYTVKLNRCAGKSIAHETYGCVAKSVENVDVLVEDDNRASMTISMQNITACHDICTLNESSCNRYQKFDRDNCACTCMQKEAPANCTFPFRWERSHCDCVCPFDAGTYKCGKRKRFYKESCGCGCKQRYNRKCEKRRKYLNPETCYCDEFASTAQSKNNCPEDSISVVNVVIIAVSEFFFFLLLIFIYQIFRKDPHRLCYKGGCSQKQDPLPEERMDLQPSQEC